MKHLMLLLLVPLLAPAAPPVQDRPDVEILKFGWRKLPHSDLPSGEKAQEMRNEAIDARIRDAYRQDKPDFAAIRELESLKKNQVVPLDVPTASDKMYEYKFRFRNEGARQVVYLKWVYVFRDAATGRESLRYTFESKVKIGPGKEKRLVAYTNSGPPRVVDARGLEGGKAARGEEATVEAVEYSDGSLWARR
jgi:hypothetical protein